MARNSTTTTTVGAAAVGSAAPSTLRPTVPIMIALIGAVALPPLAIDMYLPSLPEISDVFDASVGTSQLTLTAFLLMLGIGQLVAGPLTDAVGRRRPLLIGLVIFVVGSVLAATASSIGVLLAARLVQGIGGSLAVVVANSSVRDFSSGDGATKLYALMMGVVGIAPVIAPTIGGFVDTAFGWRAIFWTLAVLGLLLIGMALAMLPESLAPQRRSPLRLGAVFSVYGDFVRNPRFAVPAAALIAMFGLLFAYIGGASYIYQGDFGLSVSSFGLAFGATGVAMMIATLAVNRLSSRFRSATLALIGGVTATIGAFASIAMVLAAAPFPAFLSAIFVLVFGLGMSEPALMGQAMTASDSGSGQAAALLGAAQFLLGAAATAIAGIVAAAGPLPWTVLLAAFAVLGLALMLAGTRAAKATATSRDDAGS